MEDNVKQVKIKMRLTNGQWIQQLYYGHQSKPGNKITS